MNVAALELVVESRHRQDELYRRDVDGGVGVECGVWSVGDGDGKLNVTTNPT